MYTSKSSEFISETFQGEFTVYAPEPQLTGGIMNKIDFILKRFKFNELTLEKVLLFFLR